jgi:hypothetical protein
LRVRLENNCGEWHLTATDTGKARVAPSISRGSVAIRFPAPGNKLEHLMLDVVMLALGLGFFAAAVGYTYACERL